MSQTELAKMLTRDGVILEDHDAQRLGLELASWELRLFHLPAESGGGLVKIQDVVLLKLLSPTGDEVLLQESEPAGPFRVRRKATETVTAAMRRGMKKSLPPFLEMSWVPIEFDECDAVWFEWNTTEDEQSFPSGIRYFVVRARVHPYASKFNLLRAGFID